MTGDLTVVENAVLSRRIINSIGSKNGFLNSIGAGLGPTILKGPLGCGADEIPCKLH